MNTVIRKVVAPPWCTAVRLRIVFMFLVVDLCYSHSPKMHFSNVVGNNMLRLRMGLMIKSPRRATGCVLGTSVQVSLTYSHQDFYRDQLSHA